MTVFGDAASSRVSPDPLDRPRITRSKSDGLTFGIPSPAFPRTDFARIRKADADSTISQPRYGRNQPPLNHDSTILRVESKNDFDTTIPHPIFSNHNSTTRKRIREAAAESSSSWSLGEYAVSIRSDFRSTAIDPDAFGLGIAAAELLDQHISDSAADEEPSRIAPRELIVRGSSQTFPVNPSWLSDALIFIHQNVHRHLSAADVHAHLKLSHTRVDTVFRNRLGTTIQKEIRRTSLSEAERMLRLTDIPVAEIAKRTGFASPQYFCNSFTAYYGLSPSAWRERG